MDAEAEERGLEPEEEEEEEEVVKRAGPEPQPPRDGQDPEEDGENPCPEPTQPAPQPCADGRGGDEMETKEERERSDETEKEKEEEKEEWDEKEGKNMDGGDEDDEVGDLGEVFRSQSFNMLTSDTSEFDIAEGRKLRKTSSLGKTVRFQEAEAVDERESSEENLFPDHELEEWTSSSFEELFHADDWVDITEDHLLRKKVLEPGPPLTPCPAWGQEVTLKMQGVLEDRTVVEKDRKLVFVIGEGDVNQALEECAISMRKEEIILLLADSQYTYGRLGRDPDIPAWAPLLYQLQLLDFRDKPDPLTLHISDHIRIANQKRERGNFYFQREEYGMASRAYCMALDVLVTRTNDGPTSAAEEEEEEEVNDYRVKCLNNLAATQLKLEQYDDALHTSRDVLFLDPQNIKALFRAGKLLSDKGEYEEAMETLKKALKLEPSTKAIHAELSKLVKRQSGGMETEKWRDKSGHLLGENIAPFLKAPQRKTPGISWKLLLGALVVALGSLVTSVVLTARN